MDVTYKIIAPREEIGWCGPACLHEALKRRGKNISQKKIAKVLNTTIDDGTTLYKLSDGAAKLGLDCITSEDTKFDYLQKCLQNGNIVILNWMSDTNTEDDGHFTILEEINDKFVIMNDCEWIGYLKIIEKSKFNDVWFSVDDDGEIINRWALIIK
jgi:ABC-type bacteriocin/lantibiotic exporter with double-glycine peptidase domain